jgi:hypothetical protein
LLLISFQRDCNQLQLLSGGGAAIAAIATHFETAYYNVKAAFALNLSLEAIEEIAFEFRNLPAAQAGHVNVVALGTPFIKVLLALHMHQVELVNQPVTLQKFERAVNRNLVDPWIEVAGVAQNLRCVEMLLGGLYHAENGPALVGQSKTARGQRRLQMSRSFSLWQRHSKRS